MESRLERRSWEDDTDEGYFVSITDMMIGLLFIFIIMLAYYALQLQKTQQELVTAEQTRTELLRRVAVYMHERNVRAEVDFEAGVLRLPDDMLFDKAQEVPKPAGAAALRVLADALDASLPCFAYRKSQARPESCADIRHSVEVILIEGHTDGDRLTPTVRLRDNWDLSVARASNTFRTLSEFKPSLLEYVSRPVGDQGSVPLLSVAGYSDQRPLARGIDEISKSQNRRIDLRFIMTAPSLEFQQAVPDDAGVGNANN